MKRIYLFISILFLVFAILDPVLADVSNPDFTAQGCSLLSSWLYQLQDYEQDELDSFDAQLAVLDIDEAESSGIDIGQLKATGKMVVSYLSIGEAEDYREYWQDSWDDEEPFGEPDSDAPEWLDSENPDWEGNYKVRYWQDGWQDIVFFRIDEIIDAGYDGAYLDIIDAYEYYEEEGVSDAKEQMIAFVVNLSEYAKSIEAGFLIIPQNSPELVDDSAYLSALDGLGKEETWYTGDNPNNDEDISYELEFLDKVVDNCKFVLAVDYPSQEEKQCDFISKADEHDFAPFVGNRELDALTQPECSSLLCEDGDGDGYNITIGTGGECGPVDCDDDDFSVNPGAVETYDGLDNNCDGNIDEGFQDSNEAPSIISTPPTYVELGTLYSYIVGAEDTDGDPIEFSLQTYPDGMSIDPDTGSISWMPSQAGTYGVLVLAQDNNSNNDSQSFDIEVKSMLEILNVEIKIDGDKDRLYDGDVYDDVLPGSEIEFEVEIKNLFEDIEIEDIEIDIKIKDIDDNDDLEEDASSFDLDGKEDNSERLSFLIPEYADNGFYDLIITIEGEDENHTVHTDEWDLNIHIDKSLHDLRIMFAKLQPLAIACGGGKDAYLSFSVINLGRKDEDDARIEISSPSLGILEQLDFDLEEGTGDSDDEVVYSDSISLNVDPLASSGEHSIRLDLYRDRDEIQDSYSVELEVQDCPIITGEQIVLTPAKEKPEENDTNDTLYTDVSEEHTNIEEDNVLLEAYDPSLAYISQKEETESSSHMGYVVFLAASFILVAGLFVFVLLRFLRRLSVKKSR